VYVFESKSYISGVPHSFSAEQVAPIETVHPQTVYSEWSINHITDCEWHFASVVNMCNIVH